MIIIIKSQGIWIICFVFFFNFLLMINVVIALMYTFFTMEENSSARVSSETSKEEKDLLWSNRKVKRKADEGEGGQTMAEGDPIVGAKDGSYTNKVLTRGNGSYMNKVLTSGNAVPFLMFDGRFFYKVKLNRSNQITPSKMIRQSVLTW